MRITINLTCLYDGQNVDGIGQFALNLMRGLQSAGKLNKDIVVVVFESFRKQAERAFPEVSVLSLENVPDLYSLNKYERLIRLNYINQALLPRMIKKTSANLHYHPFTLAESFADPKTPTVFTLHDLYFKNFPQNHKPLYIPYLNLQYNRLLRHSDHLVVPSDFVRNDIAKFYPRHNMQSVSVIHNPVLIDTSALPAHKASPPYILSVNSNRIHKNLRTLLKAFRSIEDQIEHHLVLVGSKGNSRLDLLKLADELGIKKIKVAGYLADAERNELYRCASLFVSPSMHEGFGMTPVEAALFRIPVVTTRETSIPEATKNLLNYYEPADDPKALASSILNVLHNPPSPESLARISDVFAKSYDARHIAEQYYSLFERIASEARK